MITLTIVATKGGVGKTTIAANLGGLLADLGYRVLLIDADIQPALSRHYQLSPGYGVWYSSPSCSAVFPSSAGQ